VKRTVRRTLAWLRVGLLGAMVFAGCGSDGEPPAGGAPAAQRPPCPLLGVLPDAPNPFELQWGATNTNAALGSGRMTSTVSLCGEITSLKWPSPSYYDQIDYLTSNDIDARLKPHFGALDSAGAFQGLAYVTRTGQRGFTWLRDLPWEHEQTYTSDTSNVAVTTMRNTALGLVVRAYQFILPDANVMVNHYEVERQPTSPVREATLIFYANFAPTMARQALFPVADWALDFKNDHAVVYDEQERALLHYLPQSERANPHRLARVSEILRQPGDGNALRAQVASLIRELGEPGVYIAAGARGGDDGYQCGFDQTDICRIQSRLTENTIRVFDLGDAFAEFVRIAFQCERQITHPDGPLGECRSRLQWTYDAESAYTDAMDGQLSGSPIAACQANAALAKRLTFSGNVASATIDIAIADTRDGAYELLRAARAQSPQAQRSATEAWWERFLAPARLPQTDDPVVLAFAKRSLAVIRTAMDEASGGIVASVNTQPPYGEDWPRDGAFINYALDLAGYHDLVTRHNRFYARVQRKRPAPWSPLYDFGPCDPQRPVYPNCVPAGTVEANYYTDPQAAIPGLPLSFEIDAAGLVVWTLWEHAKFLRDPEARTQYLAEVCPSISLGATNLANCKDETNNLQCYANEDDTIPLTQSLLGAQTVLLALRSAIEAASACGFDSAEVERWQARAAELEEAIPRHFLRSEPVPHLEGPRGPWVIWPVKFLRPGDALATTHAQLLWRQGVQVILERTAPESGYNAEPLVAVAYLARQRNDRAMLEEARRAVKFFVRNITTNGTLHMSESYGRVQVDRNGDGIAPDYWPQNDVPHVWEHALLYTAAMFAFGEGPID
jgi:hypothetical protein